MARFPDNDIITLVGASPRHDLAESTGPDLRLAELLGEAGIGDLALGYGTAAGDGRLRQEPDATRSLRLTQTKADGSRQTS